MSNTWSVFITKQYEISKFPHNSVEFASLEADFIGNGDIEFEKDFWSLGNRLAYIMPLTGILWHSEVRNPNIYWVPNLILNVTEIKLNFIIFLKKWCRSSFAGINTLRDQRKQQNLNRKVFLQPALSMLKIFNIFDGPMWSGSSDAVYSVYYTVYKNLLSNKN